MPTFGEVVERCVALIERRGRVSHTALRLEFRLDDETMAVLREELVEVLGVADDDGRVLTRRGLAPAQPADAPAPATADDDGEQVTVLLCDLATTPATEALEREALDVVIARFQAICHEVARRLDGHLQPWISDGVAVFFGHAHAHDDDAFRAVRCGWEIQRAIGAARDVIEREFGVPIAVRIGIATGTSRVGATGPDGGDAANPFGDTPNMAARVQAVGEPGAVVVDAATYALAKEHFAFDDLGPHELTGRLEPIGLFRLGEPRGDGRRHSVLDDPAPTALVGRTSERALLRALAERAVAGTRSAVLLRGESGIGKTRLIQALRTTAEDELRMRRVHCSCSPYHRGSPLHPIAAGLRRLWRLDGEDAPARLAGPVAERAGFAGDEPAIALLSALLGLSAPAADPLPPMSARRRRRESLAAIQQALAGEAREQPLLIVVEDLHWADATTLELLGALLDGQHELPLLLAMSARPEFRPAWNATLQRLELRRLNRAETLRIIGLVAGETELADADLEELAKRAEGIPLLAEELTRAVLATQDDEDAPMPQTLFGCLMARLDRDATERSVAQLAGTVGREFDAALLTTHDGSDGSALQWGLERLVADDVIVPTGLGTYAFHHPLMQEAARSSLRKHERRNHDRRIARSLLERFPDLAAAEPERVARHLEYAGETVEAVGHWQRAGLHALRQAAYREAGEHFERGLSLASTRMPDGPIRVSIELTLRVLACLPIAATRGWSSPEFAAHHARAIELATRIDGAPKLFATMLGLVSNRVICGEVEEAVALGRTQIAVAEAVGDPDLVLEAEYEVGAALVHLGRYRDGLAHLARTVELYDPVLHHKHAVRYGRNPAASALAHRAIALACRDDRTGTRHALKDARAVLRANPHPFSEAWVRCGAATVAVIYDERDAVLREADAVIKLATREEFPDWLAMAMVLRGWARVRAGEHEALEEARDGLTRWTSRGAVAMRPFLLGLYADAARLAGEHEFGLAAVEQALDPATGGERWADPELHRCRAELLRCSGDRYGAQRSAKQALAIARRTSAAGWERRAAITLARVGDQPSVPQ